jgi:hypothetical protein
MIRANHEFLVANSPGYLFFFESKLCQVERSEPGGTTHIRLFDPNDAFKCFFQTIETIWPILKPEFNRKIKVSKMCITPSANSNKTEFNFNLQDNSLSVNFLPERTSEIHKVVNEALVFYEFFLIDDLFSIGIRNQKNFTWSPYLDGDVHIISDLTNLMKSYFLNKTSNSELNDHLYWIREMLIKIKNSKKYIPPHLIDKTCEKYLELDFIMTSLV